MSDGKYYYPGVDGQIDSTDRGIVAGQVSEVFITKTDAKSEVETGNSDRPGSAAKNNDPVYTELAAEVNKRYN